MHKPSLPHLFLFSLNIMKKTLFAFLFVLPLTLAACNSQEAPTDETTDTSEMEDSMDMDDATTDDAMDTSEENEMMDDMDETAVEADYTLDMSNFAFEPNRIEMAAGETITVKLVNVQGTHDFVIDELAVDSDTLRQGDERMVEITAPADAAGQEYVFYCSIGEHRENGMEGTLVITGE